MKRTKEYTLNQLDGKWNVFFVVLLLIGCIFVVAPVVLIVIVSFSSEASISEVGYSFFPTEWSLEGYRYLLKMGDQLWRSYLITIFYTVVGTVLSLLVMSMYAYAISIRNFRYKKLLTWFVFLTMLISGGLVPTYIVYSRYLHLRDTIWVFLLPGLMNGSYVIILRTFIKTTVPESLYDAARIDGAGHFTIFFKIVLPLCKAGLATIALFTLVIKWNDWFTGMLYIENPNLVPLQTLLTKLQNSVDFIKNNTRAAATPDGLALLQKLPSVSLRMACTVAVILPMLFAYPFFQKYFVKGLTVGGIKE